MNRKDKDDPDCLFQTEIKEHTSCCLLVINSTNLCMSPDMWVNKYLSKKYKQDADVHGDFLIVELKICEL